MSAITPDQTQDDVFLASARRVQVQIPGMTSFQLPMAPAKFGAYRHRTHIPFTSA
jgi:hypothetical protein